MSGSPTEPVDTRRGALTRVGRVGRVGRAVAGLPVYVVPLLVVGVALVVYLAVPAPEVHLAVYAVAGAGGALSTVVGPWLNRPERRWPWRLFVVCQVLFASGTLVRSVAAGQGTALLAVMHVTLALAYLTGAVGVLMLARGQGGRGGRAARLDAAMVAIGLGTFVVLELSLPLLRTPGLPAWQAVAEALKPLYDLTLLLSLLLLGFTSALRLTAYRCLAGALMLLIMGDLGLPWLHLRGVAVETGWTGVPYLVAIGLVSVAALHPSMRSLGLAVRAGRPEDVGTADGAEDARRGGAPDDGLRVGQEWTTLRMALFVPALTLPAVLLMVRPRSAVELAVIGTASSSALLLLLVRARTALRTIQHVRAHDVLTGLLGRDTFITLLRRRLSARATGEAPWVVVVDLDGHRHVVQFWGHRTGDALVRQTAERLAAELPPDALLARVGGDVFAAVLPGPRAVAAAAAERLRTVVGAGHDVDGLELVCTASIGVAPTGSAGGEDLDPVTVLRDADTAMNAARSLGGDQVRLFEPSLRADIERRAALEQALRYAAGDGELSVVYQSVVDLPSGRVIGAEALLRWSNPEFGAVPPLEFIQIAEETGMIEDLGAWVLSQACRRLARWDATGLVSDDFTMAVNVSTRQLRDDALPGRLREVLRETGLAPGRVVLEVTESAMHEDQDAFIAVLTTLRGIGVQISIDDFGTGYSSLSYLSKLPATSVKLDRSLVRDVARPPGDAIAAAVQGIASALGLVVVAEGVETEDQRAALSELNIAHAQGFLWGRPMPPKDFLAGVAPPAPNPRPHPRPSRDHATPP